MELGLLVTQTALYRCGYLSRQPWRSLTGPVPLHLMIHTTELAW